MWEEVIQRPTPPPDASPTVETPHSRRRTVLTIAAIIMAITLVVIVAVAVVLDRLRDSDVDGLPGRVYLTASIERQLRSYAYLTDVGLIDGAHWHFFANSESNSLGPSGPVLDLLEELGIDHTIHPPRM